MSQHYLLPCECGQSTPVTTAQAGRTLACTCGRELRVPTLAGLRQLEPSSAPVKSAPAAAWNPVRGILFVVGVLLAIAGLAIGGYGSYLLRQIDLNAFDEEFAKQEMQDVGDIDQMSPADTLRLWQEIQSHGLQGIGPAGSAITVKAREFFRFWMTVTIAGFSAAGIGILLAGLSLIGAGRPAP